MTSVNYIIQNCNDQSEYRLTFNNTTHLNSGEIWDIECNNINNGCYYINEDTNKVLDEINGDDCTFIEYVDCETCEEANLLISSLMSDPSQSCYRWDRCDAGSGHLYTLITDTPIDDSILYYGVCYEITSLVVNTDPTDLSGIPNNLYYGKCSSCIPTFLDCDFDL